MIHTRSKVLPGSEAAARAARLIAANERVVVLISYFDPMISATAAVAASHSACGAKVFVIIAGPSDPILERDARTILAASLSSVCCVTSSSESELPALLALLPDGANVIDDREAESERRQHLFRHVHARLQVQ